MDAHIHHPGIIGEAVLGHRELELDAFGQRIHLLYGAFAKGIGAKNQRPVEVLERAREDLRAGCGLVIDEDGDGERLGRAVGAGVEGLGEAGDGVAIGTDGGDDAPVLQESVGCVGALQQGSAGVSAQVQHQRAHRALADGLEAALQPFVRLLAEVVDAHDADVARVAVNEHIGDLHLGALQRPFDALPL